MRNTSELKTFAKKVLRKFWYRYHEKAKKISVLGQKILSYKIKYMYKPNISIISTNIFGHAKTSLLSFGFSTRLHIVT